MVKAIARAFRWRDMLETGEYATVREIAAVEKINESYVSRVLRLTLLAPKIVKVIIDGHSVSELQLDSLMKPFTVDWQGQAEIFDLVSLKVASTHLGPHNQVCAWDQWS